MLTLLVLFGGNILVYSVTKVTVLKEKRREQQSCEQFSNKPKRERKIILSKENILMILIYLLIGILLVLISPLLFLVIYDLDNLIIKWERKHDRNRMVSK